MNVIIERWLIYGTINVLCDQRDTLFVQENQSVNLSLF